MPVSWMVPTLTECQHLGFVMGGGVSVCLGTYVHSWAVDTGEASSDDRIIVFAANLSTRSMRIRI